MGGNDPLIQAQPISHLGLMVGSNAGMAPIMWPSFLVQV